MVCIAPRVAAGSRRTGDSRLLISPLIDFLVISGSGFLAIGSLLKFIAVATRYQPAILGLSSVDFLLMCAVCWAASLVLAARTWVQLNEPELIRQRRERLQRVASWQVDELDDSDEPDGSDDRDDDEVVPVSGVVAGER
jgi:hypothetical protein